jgi:hypothetical protein
MTGRKILMDFEVTPTSHTLEAYAARGGYQALAKVLREMKPAEVTKETGSRITCSRTRTKASPAPSRTAGSSSTCRTSCSSRC